MIAFIRGTVVSYTNDNVIVETSGGIGYRIFMSNPSVLTLNKQTRIYTYQHIREDAQMLFGFINVEEHDLFLRLISVKGIGPKIAINALSVGGWKQIIEAIETNDAAYLKSLPGIGNKAASQIVLDLKGKLVETKDVGAIDTNLKDAIEALKSLGYKANEVNPLVKHLRKEEGKSVDEYIKMALQLLAKQKGV